MSERIRCLLLTPANRCRLSLRRYAGDVCPAAPRRGYHNAATPLFDVAEHVEPGDFGDVMRREGPEGAGDLTPEQNERWPTRCECGYTFVDTDERQIFSESLYIRSDTGETVTLADAPAGAMWFAAWMRGFFRPQIGDSPLIVKTPGGDWMVDAQASNCTMADDHNQERHHCWVAHGTPPEITVDKNGVTCAAGAGSIQAGTYHGFLRGGYLEA